MKNLILFYLTILLPLSVSHSQTWDLDPYCYFACEYIPPIEESLLIENGIEEPLGIFSGVTFMSWNIYKARKEHFFENFFTLSLNTDIVVVQEHIGTAEVNELYQDSMEPFHSATGVSFFMKDETPTGVATLCRWPIARAELQRTDDLEPFVKSPKALIITEHNIPTIGRLLVVNIHGINFRKAQGLRRQLAKTEPRLATHTGPIIFAGDFNTKTKKRLKETDEFMDKYGLRRVMFDSDDRSTFFNLDHVYIRGLEVVEKALLTEIKGSDHPPIKLSLIKAEKMPAEFLSAANSGH